MFDYNHNHSEPQRRQRVPEEVIRATFLPIEVRLLIVPCKFGHVDQMEYIGNSQSANGWPVAVYQCPHCGYRENWGADREKKPRFVFSELSVVH